MGKTTWWAEPEVSRFLLTFEKEEKEIKLEV